MKAEGDGTAIASDERGAPFVVLTHVGDVARGFTGALTAAVLGGMMRWESRPDDRIVRLMLAPVVPVSRMWLCPRSLATRLSFFCDARLNGKAAVMLRQIRQNAGWRRVCVRVRGHEGRVAGPRRRPSRFGLELPRGVYRTRVSEMRTARVCVGVPFLVKAAGHTPITMSCALGAVMLPLRGG